MNCYNIAIYTAEITDKTPDELANKGIELLDKLLADDNKGEEPDLDEKKLAEFLKMFH